MKSKKKYNNLRYFFISMIISEIFLMLFLGLIVAEHNIRYIILGSEEAFFECNIFSAQKNIKFIFMGQMIKLDFSFFESFVKNIAKKLFLCFIY